VDQFASNTLRTLGIIVVSIFVILASLTLLLLALCFGMLGNLGSSGHHDPQAVNLVLGALAVAALIIALGVVIIAKLAKGIVRESAVPPLRGNTPDPPQPQPLTASTPPLVPPSALPPAVTPPTPARPAPAHSTHAQPRFAPDVVTHLSPASRAAVQRLVLAIAVQIAVQLVLIGLGRRWVFYSIPASRQSLLAISISALASNVPYLVLLFSLLRRPGRRAFAYSLAVPSILLFFGLFGNPVSIFYFLRFTNSAASFLLLIPWALHILILYLAWKAIRLTGIFPNPARLVVAAVVVFFYYTLLPVASTPCPSVFPL